MQFGHHHAEAAHRALRDRIDNNRRHIRHDTHWSGTSEQTVNELEISASSRRGVSDVRTSVSRLAKLQEAEFGLTFAGKLISNLDVSMNAVRPREVLKEAKSDLRKAAKAAGVRGNRRDTLMRTPVLLERALQTESEKMYREGRELRSEARKSLVLFARNTSLRGPVAALSRFSMIREAEPFGDPVLKMLYILQKVGSAQESVAVMLKASAEVKKEEILKAAAFVNEIRETAKQNKEVILKLARDAKRTNKDIRVSRVRKDIASVQREAKALVGTLRDAEGSMSLADGKEENADTVVRELTSAQNLMTEARMSVEDARNLKAGVTDFQNNLKASSIPPGRKNDMKRQYGRIIRYANRYATRWDHTLSKYEGVDSKK